MSTPPSRHALLATLLAACAAYAAGVCGAGAD